jgi:hypothetical protein
MLYLPGLKYVVADFLSHPPPPRNRWNSHYLGGNRSSGLWSCGRPAKLLRKNAALARRFIPPTSLSPSRQPKSRLRCFNRCFSPHCPTKIQKRHFFHFHNISHPGRLASRRMVSSRFVWRGLVTNITAWSQACLDFQQAKIHRHTRLQPQPVPILQRRFLHLHIDLVGPYSTVAVAISFSLSLIQALWSYTFHIAKQQHTILSRMVQLKDCIVSRMPFAHTLPRRLGLRSYLLYSSASVHGSFWYSNCPAQWIFARRWIFCWWNCQQKKTLDAPAFSLATHNSSTHLPAELPDELLHAPFVWLRRGGVVPPLHCPYGVVQRRPRSFTIRFGSRDEIVSVSHLKACTEADATPGSPWGCGQPPGKLPGGPATTKRVSFSDRWFLHLLFPWHRQATVQELFFQLRTGFLHALGRTASRLHSSGTRTISGNCLRDWASDLSSSRLTPEIEGSPVETWLHPWLTVKPVGCTVPPLYTPCL